MKGGGGGIVGRVAAGAGAIGPKNAGAVWSDAVGAMGAAGMTAGAADPIIDGRLLNTGEMIIVGSSAGSVGGAE
ncbi:MAG: hypothetical protein P4L82_08345 [Ancalomicrobiaceae bacterium]|nr:hypothetical protein [Ancalomicrobiaceae bacterium]